ncbi:MAG: hypothetical protein HY658_03580 [Actinobacteria bacterium]|nr:hypothetical protein [Actinomycetota bacterium]
MPASPRAPRRRRRRPDPEALRRELLHLAELDRKAHRTGRFDAALREANTTRLREILLEVGWPGRSVVGDEGADAAWLIALHADQDPRFQRLAADLLERAVLGGEAPGRHLAYLIDRLRVRAGEPQVYGTQITVEERAVVAYPVEDRGGLDERRRLVGLEPIEEYLTEAAARHAAGQPLEP